MKRLPSWIGLVLFGVALLGLAAAPAAGCVDGNACLNGFVNDVGDCEALCETEKCKPGNVCVANRCTLPCTGHHDCAYGEECVEGEGDSGDDVWLCVAGKRRAPTVDPNVNSQPGGYGWPCLFGDADCLCPYGGPCGSGDPAKPVGARVCPNGLECDPSACSDCQPDPDICGDDAMCNAGRCGDGSACTYNTCDVETECTHFSCLSAGEGDANAYCTRHDCASDEECPNGYYCGNTRDPHDICGNTCNAGFCSHDSTLECTQDGDCQKGNNGICGETSEPCLDIAAAQAAGTTHFEGGVCAMRRTCLKRTECTRCSESADCGLGNAQVCSTHAGQDVCLRLCSKSTDCRLDEACQDYVPSGGGAGSTCSSQAHVDCETAEDCAVSGDTCEPRKVCVPAGGACDASDSASKFCRHCVDDEDCGGVDKSGRWACTEVANGEFACLNFDFDIPCDSDADCPLSPAGRHGECMDDPDTEVSPESSLFNRCYWPRCDPLDPLFPCMDPVLADRYTCN